MREGRRGTSVHRGALVLFILCFLHAGSFAEPGTKPCEEKQEYRQFDFWIGEWEVRDTSGQAIATSVMQRMVDGCMILENYSQDDGYTGKSINFIDGFTGKWRQVWVDSRGNSSEFAGERRDSGMYFEGKTRLADGKIIMRRMTFVRLGADRVRQFSERSTDGMTWTPAYDFLYVRKDTMR